MHCVTLLILLAVTARAHAKKLVAKVVDKLFHRILKAWPADYTNLDDATLRKESPAHHRQTFHRRVEQEYQAEAAFMRAMKLNTRVKELLTQKHGKPNNTIRERLKSAFHSPAKAGLARQQQRKSFDMFRLPKPYTHKGAVQLMHHFIKNGGNKPLPVDVVEDILIEFTQKYGNLHPKPVVNVDIPQAEGSQFIVVGDTHGQLNDVLCIFRHRGIPSANNVFLFNGDIADRGQNALEIFLLLFAFFLAEPSSVIINRGNHENEEMNQMEADYGGGFYDEILSKYPHYGPMIIKRFVNAFKVLSLAVVVQNKYFVVHGGLASREVLTMEFVNSIDHKECTCPDGKDLSEKEQAFADLLWSDPIEEVGTFASRRGQGIQFGPDVTERFLNENGLLYILRSHQLPEDQRGFKMHHGGHLITIFSASNYCGDAGNQGSFLVLTPETFPGHDIFEFYAPPLKSLEHLFRSDTAFHAALKEQGDSTELSAVRSRKEIKKMAWAIIENKPVLWAKFCDDVKGDLVDLDAWAQICSSVMGTALPWKEAAQAWGLQTKSGQISIHNFLMKFRAVLDKQKYLHVNQFKNKAIKQVFESILNRDMSLNELLKYFDHDGDGSVTQPELFQVLSKFDLGLAPSQLQSLVRNFFMGPPGSKKDVDRILVHDWLMQFTVAYRNAGGDEGIFWVQELMHSLVRLVAKMPKSKLKSKSLELKPGTTKDNAKGSERVRLSMGAFVDFKGSENVRCMFEVLDRNKDGLLQIEEFVEGCAKIPGIDKLKSNDKPVTKQTLLECANAIDSSNTGAITYLEFLQAFSIEDARGDLADVLAAEIQSVLFRYRHAVRIACKFFDRSSSGFITVSDFQLALECLSDAIAFPELPFTSTQIELLVEAVAGEQQDVNYEDFLRSFRLIMPGD